MADGLDVIIVDDDPAICEVVSEIVKRFYTWGDVFAFTDPDEATIYCRNRDSEVAIFVLDVFLGGKSGFFFLDTIADKYPMAHEDTIIITGNASDDVVNMCVASDITSLLEKPLKPYALQLAIRSIVTKYLKFAKRVLRDSTFAESIARF
ncbi:MAG: response regulator [Deltaproteobacteria bacterium]|nr:response regulator [Deltaproteobacteria bacterium]